MFPKGALFVLNVTLNKPVSNICYLLTKHGMCLPLGLEETWTPSEPGCGSGLDSLQICCFLSLRIVGQEARISAESGTLTAPSWDHDYLFGLRSIVIGFTLCLQKYYICVWASEYVFLFNSRYLVLYQGNLRITSAQRLPFLRWQVCQNTLGCSTVLSNRYHGLNWLE